MLCQLVRVLIAQRDANPFQPAVAMQQDMGSCFGRLTAEPRVLPWLAPHSTITGLCIGCRNGNADLTEAAKQREPQGPPGCRRVWFRSLPGAKQMNPQVLVIHSFPCFPLHALHCNFQHRAAATSSTRTEPLVAVMKSFRPISL